MDGLLERFARHQFADYKVGALPGERYTSAAFFAREWESVWTKAWLLMGRVNDIPEAGDFVVEEIGPESILMVRQADGAVRAFHNVCQHRGNKLVHVPEGSMNSFTCNYHSWKWGIDGELLAVQDEEDFSGGSPCGKVRLTEIKCDIFASFIWINMDSASITLKEYLGPLWERWSAYPIGRMTRLQALTVHMPCNWKAMHDNFSETYHFSTVHTHGLEFMEDDYRTTECELFDEGHTLICMKGSTPGYRYIEREGLKLGQQIANELRAWDLDPDDFRDRPLDARAALQRQKRLLGPSRGHPHYDNLTDAQLTDTNHYTVFPNFSTTLQADGFLFMRIRPHASDPNQCYFDVFYYAAGNDEYSRVLTSSGATGALSEAPREMIEYGERSLGPILDGDVSTMAGQQNGFHSRGYQGGVLADQEIRMAYYHYGIDRCIAGERPGRVGRG